jgi:hypothetical protein
MRHPTCLDQIPPRGGYSFSDTGSDSFFGDFLSNEEINSRPAAGTLTLPSRQAENQ